MTDTTFFLEIVCGPVGHKLPFSSYEEARIQLDALSEKIGRKFSNDPDYRTHRVISGDGELVVSVTDVVSARVVDMAKFRNLVKAEDDFLAEREAKNYETLGRAIAAALQAART